MKVSSGVRGIFVNLIGIDASQFYLYSMCQPMPAGLYTRWEYDTDSIRFKPQQNKSRNFENMVMSNFQRQRPDCKIESFYTTGTQKKIDCFKVDGFCAHCNTVFEAMGCFYHYCLCQETKHSLTEDEIEVATKRKKWTGAESSTSKKKYVMLSKCGNVTSGISIRRQRVLKNILENHFLTNVH